ncbi:MAG TPA: hypothetical protein DEP36_12920 [Gammaproteobacteria bacterium]|nr:hypothetical protein [Gammaproteobacteria bacterium]
MLTIRAHGVPSHPDDASGTALSPAQHRLLTDPAPIRVCGAPTGSGKTYAFLQAAKRGELVLFVVPTQALAGDIEASARDQDIPIARWDGAQSAQLRANGLEPWIERKLELEHLKRDGGMVVTTPETLGAILLGRPQQQKEPQARAQLTLDDFQQVRHIVFDEAHTLTERAFGFLHFWAVLVLCWHRRDPANGLKLSLLSATHSNLFEGLCKSDDKEESYIPPDAVAFFDETIESKRGDALRMLHGDVDIEIGAGDVSSCIRQYASEPLMQGYRLLILYDSLKNLVGDVNALKDEFIKLGVQPDECFMINGQDRKSDGRALDGSGFEAGLIPEEKHRVILATSCIEAGVNIKNLRYAILDPGNDAAALLQRIGRVARGAVNGKIWLTCPDNQPSHWLRLAQFDGSHTIGEIFQLLAPLRNLRLDRAQRLGSAYWSMLKREQRSIYEGLLEAYSTLSAAKAPGGWLNSLHAQVAAVTNRRDHDRYVKWLKAVDHELIDLRGFAPSVRIQFADYPVIEYSQDWALKYLEAPDLPDEGDGVWRYRHPRNAYLLVQPKSVNVNLLCPDGNVFPGQYYPDLQKYAASIKGRAGGCRDERFLREAADFILATGILVRDTTYADSII